MTTPDAPERDSFRDHLATADQTGKRLWVYAAKPKGRLYNARTIVAAGLLAFLFAAPFIRLNDEPLLLFNILERRFIIFGLAFWPQDFHLFVLATITFIVFVVLFTAIFGRLFCGWICPQTVFMEMVFRRIEYWIEGGPARQRKLTAQLWNGEKTFKRLFKHGVFFAISFVIGNTFLAYLVGTDNLLQIITDPPSQHLVGLIAMLIFSFMFYGVFAWFREQACTLVCPYGRLQSVLIDRNSIVVAYDYKRGEPRAALERGGKKPDAGDCVDCLACVHVCPTGIDIRNGTQLECVNCTACIDACNRTMRKVGLPEGLIRYSSEARLASGERFKLTGRIVIYSMVLTILLTISGFLLFTRADIETTILRAPGTRFVEQADGTIRNLYTVKIVNKTFETLPITFRLRAPSQGHITTIGDSLVVAADAIAETALLVDIPAAALHSSATMIEIDVISRLDTLETVRTSFRGPERRTPQ